MDPAMREALGAAIQLNFNLAQALCIITICKAWFKPETSNDFLIVVDVLMSKVYAPIRLITSRLSPHKDFAPYVFLAILIPAQLIASFKINHL